MKCFQFSNGQKDKHQARNLASSRSSSGSEFNTLNGVFDLSAASMRRSPLPTFSQKPSNLRVFTFSELKNATKNFSRSVVLGEGGFGSVYRGSIKSLDDPQIKIEVAVKQLSRKGVQVRCSLSIFTLLVFQ